MSPGHTFDDTYCSTYWKLKPAKSSSYLCLWTSYMVFMANHWNPLIMPFACNLEPPPPVISMIKQLNSKIVLACLPTYYFIILNFCYYICHILSRLIFSSLSLVTKLVSAASTALWAVCCFLSMLHVFLPCHLSTGPCL